MSTVFWAYIAGCEYSLVGEFCRLLVQSFGRLLQFVSTVWWANTAAAHYFTLRGIPTIICILEF